MFKYEDTLDNSVSVRGCDWKCPLPEFISRLDYLQISPDSWENECTFTKWQKIKVFAMIGICCVFILAFLLTVK